MTSLVPPSGLMFIVVLDFMEQDYWTRLLVKFIVIFYIWCCYSIVAYVHLRLRLQLQHPHPSVYNYVDYSFAVGHCASSDARFVVGIVALRAMLIVRRRLCNLHRFLMLPIDWSWSNTTPHVHTVPFLIQDHHTAPCSACVAFICIASWQCPRTFSDFAKHFDF